MSGSGKVSRTFDFFRVFWAAEKMIENWNWNKGASPIVTLLEVTSSSLRTWLNVVFFHIFHFLSFSSLLLLMYMNNQDYTVEPKFSFCQTFNYFIHRHKQR